MQVQATHQLTIALALPKTIRTRTGQMRQSLSRSSFSFQIDHVMHLRAAALGLLERRQDLVEFRVDEVLPQRGEEPIQVSLSA